MFNDSIIPTHKTFYFNKKWTPMKYNNILLFIILSKFVFNDSRFSHLDCTYLHPIFRYHFKMSFEINKHQSLSNSNTILST